MNKNIILLFLSCYFSNAQTKEEFVNFNYKEVDYQIKISDLKENLVFDEIPRTVPYKGDYLIKLSNSILNDSIVVLKSFKPFYKKIDSINWQENPFSNDTWQLYYQNLLFVAISE